MYDTILSHAELELAHKGEYTAVREMRKHISWYTAGNPNWAVLRRRYQCHGESFEELKEALSEALGEKGRIAFFGVETDSPAEDDIWR